MSRTALRSFAALGAAALVTLGSTTTATAARPRPPRPPADTVVALWHMDEQPGATVMADASGFGHDGVIGKVTLGVPSHDAGTAFEFNGPGLVRVPHSADLNPGGQPIAVSAYVLVPADLTSGDYNLVQKGVATAAGGAYKMEISAQPGSRSFGFPACAFNGLHGHNRVYGRSTVADGQWHHVVCSLTSTEAFVTVDDKPGPIAKRLVDTIANTSDLTIGGKPTNTHYFTGRADEVSVTIG